MSKYLYDIALSFAGEQRLEVEAVARELQKAGLRVFYDAYEVSNLWGKDLYQHLAKVYSEEAEFCIVFASSDYAQKAWTSHELKNAQERVFIQKGLEYILPVRFDQTKIPGIPLTVGYIDYQLYGPSQIAQFAVEKLKQSRITADSALSQSTKSDNPSPLSLKSSNYAYISGVSDGLELFPRIEGVTWGETIKISAVPPDANEDAILSRVKRSTQGFIVAFGYDVALAKLTSAVREVDGSGITTWSLNFSPERTDFSDWNEMSFNGISPDELAQMRAERILLNMHKPVGGDPYGSSMLEIGIRGVSNTYKPNGSTFPLLWNAFKKNPREFLGVAWITAAVQLQLSNCAEHVEALELSLSGARLHVRFRGRRHRVYSNQEPTRIEVNGEVDLI